MTSRTLCQLACRHKREAALLRDCENVFEAEHRHEVVRDRTVADSMCIESQHLAGPFRAVERSFDVIDGIDDLPRPRD